MVPPSAITIGFKKIATPNSRKPFGGNRLKIDVQILFSQNVGMNQQIKRQAT